MMTRNQNLSLLFLLGAVAATGCATDAPDDDGEDPTNPTDPDPEPVPLTPEGRFSIQSEFDLATNLPGTPGTIVNYFIQATDDPDDPTKFIVDELIKALPDGSVKGYAEDAAPFITGYLNDRLLEVAPNFVGKIVEVGDGFGQIVKHFGTIETLEVNAAGNAFKVVQGVHFKVDNVDLDFMFTDYGVTESRVEGLTVTLEKSGKLTISEHMVPMSYGQVLKLAVDKALIPMIDPSAVTLEDVLTSAVNCEAVGQYVYEAIGIGSPSTFESACNSGLSAASNAFYSKLNDIDSAALEFGLTGTARGVDKNRDGTMDEIVTGTWAGTLGYAGTPAPLGDNKFFGARM